MATRGHLKTLSTSDGLRVLAVAKQNADCMREYAKRCSLTIFSLTKTVNLHVP